MASLLLLRHGQIRANARGQWHGSTDSPLTWRGRRQAERTARHMVREHSRITAVYTSPLQRCRYTAQAVARALALEPVTVPDLSEYAIGDWEGMAFAELAETHEFVDRATTNPHFAPPGGESLDAVANRVVPAVHAIHERHSEEGADSQVLVVSHGAAMAVLLGAMLHDQPQRWTDYHFANCSLTELVLSPAPYVNFFNSTRHL